METQMASEIFYQTEDTIYQLLEEFETNQAVDRSLIYCFVKAFFLYAATLYLQSQKEECDYEMVYMNYKITLQNYYHTNNPTIEDSLLDQILNFFDNSYSLIQSVEIADVQDSYEFRHYTINVFELLRMILEKKSQATIRANIFDNYIRKIVDQADAIFTYLDKLKREKSNS